MPDQLSFRTHARVQTAERGITPADVRTVLASGEVIESEHREGRPYPTQLVLGWIRTRPLHVLVAVAPDAAHYVITVYEPSTERWQVGLRTRRRP